VDWRPGRFATAARSLRGYARHCRKSIEGRIKGFLTQQMRMSHLSPQRKPRPTDATRGGASAQGQATGACGLNCRRPHLPGCVVHCSRRTTAQVSVTTAQHSRPVVNSRRGGLRCSCRATMVPRSYMAGGFQSASTPKNPDSLRPGLPPAWRVVAASRPRAAHRAAPASSCAGAGLHPSPEGDPCRTRSAVSHSIRTAPCLVVPCARFHLATA
jgi:hypothetical protein